jgi:hypothetical protein
MAQRSLAIASEGFWRAASLRLAEREAARRGKPGNLKAKRRLMKKFAAQWFTIGIEHCFTAWRKYTAAKKRPVISRETKANEREFKIGMGEDLSLTVSRGNTPSTASTMNGTSGVNSPLSLSRAQTPSISKRQDTISEEGSVVSTSTTNTTTTITHQSNNNNNRKTSKGEVVVVPDDMSDAKKEGGEDEVNDSVNDADDEGGGSKRTQKKVISRRNSSLSNDMYRIPTALMGIFSNAEVRDTFLHLFIKLLHP